MEKILLDTDIGTDIDDTYALSYLLSHPDCILMGITTVSDDTVKRAYVADMLCRLFGKDIPILAGAPLRYTGEPTLNDFNRPHTYILDKFEHGEYKQDTLGAVNFLRDTILAHPHELTLLAIGPLMNVGLLFALYPEVAPLIKRLVLMGGSFFGNPRCTWDIRAEWNIICDPMAARIVMAADVPERYIVGVDLTWDYKLPIPETMAMIKPFPKLAPVYAASSQKNEDFIWFHDPLTCVLPFEPERFTFERGNIEVVTDDVAHLAETRFTPAKDGKWFVARSFIGGTEEYFRHYVDILKKASL